MDDKISFLSRLVPEGVGVLVGVGRGSILVSSRSPRAIWRFGFCDHELLVADGWVEAANRVALRLSALRNLANHLSESGGSLILGFSKDLGMNAMRMPTPFQSGAKLPDKKDRIVSGPGLCLVTLPGFHSFMSPRIGPLRELFRWPVPWYRGLGCRLPPRTGRSGIR